MPPALDLTEPTLDVGIVAHDTAGMRRFYAEVLGLDLAPEIPVPGGQVVVHRVGSSAVKLWCTNSPPDADEGGIDAAIGYRMLTLMLPDLDTVLSRAQSAGITDVERRTFGEGSGAVPIAFVRDVDGNALELVGLPGLEPSLQVGLTVSDIERTQAFFTEALGLTSGAVSSLDDIVAHSVGFGSTVVKYWHRGDGLPVQTGPISERAGIRYVTAHVADVAAAVATLGTRGVPLAMPPTEVGDAVVAFVTDPDGNWLELIQR